MLKIKDNVNLKELMTKYESQIEFEENDYLEMNFNINPISRRVSLNCDDHYYSNETNERAELLFELFQAGLVEKV